MELIFRYSTLKEVEGWAQPAEKPALNTAHYVS